MNWKQERVEYICVYLMGTRYSLYQCETSNISSSLLYPGVFLGGIFYNQLRELTLLNSLAMVIAKCRSHSARLSV